MNNFNGIGRCVRDIELRYLQNGTATAINDLVRGKEEIADLKLNRDIAETLYESAMQYIYSNKLNIGIVERQMEAERKGV